MRHYLRWLCLAIGTCGPLPSHALPGDAATDLDFRTGKKALRLVHLDCVTETTDEYAGVEFTYTIDEAARTVHVNRWGDAVDVRFGPSYITYRTLGMALKMHVSINRETWQFIMLHEGGVFVVNGSCKETTRQ